MPDVLNTKQGVVRLIKGDITLLDCDAFVFYARSDLQLGSGFGNMIAVRGGPSIKAELQQCSNLPECAALATGAGDLKARFIIHANGPKFQESDIVGKLKTTILNALYCASEKDVRSIAFPPMGTGFYGIPLPVCAEAMLKTFRAYLDSDGSVNEITICVVDSREYRPFAATIAVLNQTQSKTL